MLSSESSTFAAARRPLGSPAPPRSHFIKMQKTAVSACDWRLPKWLLRASHSTLSLPSKSNVRQICIGEGDAPSSSRTTKESVNSHKSCQTLSLLLINTRERQNYTTPRTAAPLWRFDDTFFCRGVNSFRRLRAGLIFLKCHGQSVFGPNWSLLTIGRQWLWLAAMMYRCSRKTSSSQNNIHHSGDRRAEKNTSLYKIKLLFPSESQKNDRNNTPFMVSDSREGGKPACFICFSHTHILHCWPVQKTQVS